MDNWTGMVRKILCAGGNGGVFRATVQALRPFFAGAGEQTLLRRARWRGWRRGTWRRNGPLERNGCERVKRV